MKSTPENISWSRVLAEGLVIVVSILLAFGIDAWWSDQQLRRDERALLLELRSTLTDDLESLVDAQETMIQVAVELRTLIEHLESGTEMTSVDQEYQEALWFLDRFVVVTVRIAPFETLKARGLHLISNQRFRAQLTALYEDWIPRMIENSEIDQRLARQQILPYKLEFFELDGNENWLVRRQHDEARSLALTLARFRLMTLERFYLPSFDETRVVMREMLHAIDAELD